MSKWMYVAGIALIAGFAALMVMELRNSTTPYVTKVADIRSFGDRPVQFKGRIVQGKTTYDRATHDLCFALADDAGKTLDVRYDGPKPGSFVTADYAVVRGVYRGGKFRADQLLLKCPSKYQGKR
jgi:cytochrome c-type biogenesis protein CcmE